MHLFMKLIWLRGQRVFHPKASWTDGLMAGSRSCNRSRERPSTSVSCDSSNRSWEAWDFANWEIWTWRPDVSRSSEYPKRSWDICDALGGDCIMDWREDGSYRWRGKHVPRHVHCLVDDTTALNERAEQWQATWGSLGPFFATNSADASEHLESDQNMTKWGHFS